MEEVLVNKQLEVIRKSLARFFHLGSSLITFSKTLYGADGFYVEIEINFKIPQDNLRKFRVTTYMFSISEVSEEGFKYEKQYYTFKQLNTFLEKVSREIEKLK